MMLGVVKSQMESIRSCTMLSWHRCNADDMYLMWKLCRKADLLNVLQNYNSVVVIDIDLNFNNKEHIWLTKNHLIISTNDAFTPLIYVTYLKLFLIAIGKSNFILHIHKHQNSV